MVCHAHTVSKHTPPILVRLSATPMLANKSYRKLVAASCAFAVATLAGSAVARVGVPSVVVSIMAAYAPGVQILPMPVPDRSGNTTAASQSRANLSVPSTASSRDESATAQQSTLNAGAPSFQSQDSLSTTSLWVRSDQAVLLQTAQTLAFNPEVPQKS